MAVGKYNFRLQKIVDYHVHVPGVLVCLAALDPGEVVAPVPDVKQEEDKGKSKSGKNINLLGLVLEVLHPASQSSRPLMDCPPLVE